VGAFAPHCHSAATALRDEIMARAARISAAIMSLMEHGGRHAWTLDELQADLVRTGQKVDFSSVFRAAEKLAGEGAIRKLVLEGGRARYERVGAHHDHLRCVRCNDLIALPCVIPRRRFAALEARMGVAITEHHVIFEGLCHRCKPAIGRRNRHKSDRPLREMTKEVGTPRTRR
jgi:Fe2+ or Zn2+ uptake regulation protein